MKLGEIYLYQFAEVYNQTGLDDIWHFLVKRSKLLRLIILL